MVIAMELLGWIVWVARVLLPSCEFGATVWPICVWQGSRRCGCWGRFWLRDGDGAWVRGCHKCAGGLSWGDMWSSSQSSNPSSCGPLGAAGQIRGRRARLNWFSEACPSTHANKHATNHVLASGPKTVSLLPFNVATLPKKQKFCMSGLLTTAVSLKKQVTVEWRKSVATLEQSMPRRMLSKSSSQLIVYVKCRQWKHVNLHTHLQQ